VGTIVPDGQDFASDARESLSGDGSADLTRLREVAHRVLKQPATFLSWLDGLCRDDSLAAEVAARSYWHPNGFAKLVLHTSAEYRIRLHVWPSGSEEISTGESNPHSHRWEFSSTVIAGGGLHMVEYTEDSHRGKPYDRYRYGSDPANPAALRHDGEVRLFKVRSPHVTRGQVYSCDTSVVHTVRPIEAGLTATVVIQGPHQAQSTVVYCKPGQSDDQPNGELTESDFRLLAKSVLAECEPSS